MRISIEIIPEDSNGAYTFSWQDTLCSQFKSDWDYLQKRPYELYFYILSSTNDTLGTYTGLSSPRQWTWFQTQNNDSIIQLSCSVGVNHFSKYLAEQSDDFISQFNKNNIKPIQFELKKVNIDSALRKRKEILLFNNEMPR